MFFCKISFLKKNGIQLPADWRTSYMPEICLNVQNVDYKGAEGKSFFQIFKWGLALVLINVNVGF